MANFVANFVANQPGAGIPNVGQIVRLLRSKKDDPRQGFQAGDFVNVIAREYHVPETGLAAGQQFAECNQIQVPQVLLPPSERARNGIFYRIERRAVRIGYTSPKSPYKNMPPISHMALSLTRGGPPNEDFFEPDGVAYLIAPYEADWPARMQATAATPTFVLPVNTQILITSRPTSYNPMTGTRGYLANINKVAQAYYDFEYCLERPETVMIPLEYLVPRGELQIIA